ncbi:MAG: LapA family protein [Patulibacter sp.]
MTDAEPQLSSAGSTPEAAASGGPGALRRTTNRAKRILLVAIGAVVALFATFNSQPVEVRWIFGAPIRTPLILAIAVAFIAGVAIGWLVAKLGGRSPQNGNASP